MNTMKRNTAILTLPLKSDEKLENPENVILEFSEYGTIDIGAMCYLKRNNQFQRVKKHISKPVIASSFNERRALNIRKLITFINKHIQNSEISIFSAHEAFRFGLIPYINWADENGLHDSFYEESATRQTLQKYNQFVHRELLKAAIKSSTAARKIQLTTKILNLYLDRDDLQDGIIAPKKAFKDHTATEPVEEHVQARYLSLCRSLFEGFSQLVLKNHEFPYGLRVPRYLSITNDILWIFPLKPWFKHPELMAPTTDERVYFAYNFQDGRLNTSDELAKKMHRKAANHLILQAKKNLIASNNNTRHFLRLRMAEVAHDSFVHMFLANTGMNFSQAKELQWTDDYVTSIERQGFKAIKWRAGGKSQSFEIQSPFLKDFKAFLNLRKYIINNSNTNYLFIRNCTDRYATAKPISSGKIRDLHEILSKIDKDIPKITPRQWRASKSDWMLRNNISTKVAATVLQNSEKAILSSYSAGSQLVHYQEMSDFLEQVSIVVRKANDQDENSTSTPAGSCSNVGTPRPIRGAPPQTSPDCQTPEGCLFCDKYHVHADERDIRKLLSIKYCIRQTSHLASSTEHFEQAFGILINRIDQIINQIENQTNDFNLVSRIKESVEVFGELDSYWEKKLELLIELGLSSQTE